ncbi:MAG: metal-sulfur cluster assembly factor [Candidatus Omnitrophica bacterium]|nr:metal-sulfur cluster assembly factor [Candidatus Omnitrophota bacterium]
MPYTTWIKKRRIFILIVLLLLLGGGWAVVSRSPFVRQCAFFQPRQGDPAVDFGLLSATPEGLRQALRTVYDLELDINLVDLGLIRDIRVDGEGVAHITIIFTSVFCPYTGVMIAQIKKAASRVPGITGVRVRVDESVNWTPELMSEEARSRLKGLIW